MRPLNRRDAWLAACWALFAVVCCGCGWERKTSFPCGQKTDSVEFLQPYPMNGGGLQIRINGHDGITQLYSRRGDMFLDFAEVYWMPNCDAVAIMTLGTPQLKLAYDKRLRREVPFSFFERQMRERIRREYRLVESTDEFEWAWSRDGRDAFFRKHPEVIPR